MKSRELVHRTLNFENSGRVPRQMWVLPWARSRYGSYIDSINKDYPDDIVFAPGGIVRSIRAKGNPFAIGSYTDDWGCVFENIHEGIMGEVRDPIVKDWEKDRSKVHIPRELLDFDVSKVNAFCRASDKFVMSGCLLRPFEQLQFIMGTPELFMELLEPSDSFLLFMREMHAFYCDLAQKWMAGSEVDALFLMDDWGSQRDLLISPDLWCEFFMPMYRDYIEIAHQHDKKAFMHSDGNILRILPHLIEIGLDAINAQIFCMGLDNLARFAGKITFWGEIDRQDLLVNASLEDIAAVVGKIKTLLWRQGGCIAQCEFGPGAKPENVRQVFASWAAE